MNINELKERLARVQTEISALIGADAIVVESNDARDLRSKLVRNFSVS